MAIEVAEISLTHLGLMEYEPCWQLQRKVHDEVVAGSRANTLLLVEHPSVFTAGRRTDPMERPQDGTPVIDVDRGGRITWHGPGQIVGYPIIKLAKPNEVVGFVRVLEDALIKTLKEFEITGISISGKTGVWIKDSNERKIAAIGVRVAKGVTMHGFALNVNPDLSNFGRIIPCGMPDAETTSMVKELALLGKELNLSIAEVTPILEKHLVLALGKISKLQP
ncbi:MAG: lipoyl(octanoyl) transferase LipB [Candidatus Nanopelagicaceae bacterium]